jgi:FAD/FMN-containing dehydrogenase
MGGQSLPRNGTAITMEIASVEPDTAARTYRVAAGTRWHQVIAALDPIGWGPAVMQSNADFGVASTFAVNAHGWPVPYGPFGSTVKAVELMLADGSIVTASREQEPELFGLAMGGYGLTSAILSLDVEMVPNALLKPVFSRMSATEIAAKFMAAVADGTTTMAYGRLDVTKRTFFKDALLIIYAPDPDSAGQPIPAAGTGGLGSALSRDIYRAQVGSELGKRARWLAETRVGPSMNSGASSRNALMNEPVSNLEANDPRYRDILHEYFIPPDRYGDFLTLCQRLIPTSGQDLLNITLRYVAADPVSRLAFAPTPRIANVMSFAQRLEPGSEASMLRLTEALIEGVADIGGSFYLPYRLHARPDQVRRIYTGAEAFADAKRRLDPKQVFRNALWDTYFA